MAERRKIREVDLLIERIDEQLRKFGKVRKSNDLRDNVKLLAKVYEEFKDLGVNAVAEQGIQARGARERIQLYLIQYPGIAIDGAELAVVSGIGDYPRRIRELRVEKGYQIASGASPDAESGINLKPDQYMLVTPIPDLDAARRWHIANRIRRSDQSSQDRILEFLIENVNKVVTTEELSYVAKNAKEYARRTRELRTEKGYAVATKFTGRPDLAMGQYVLQSATRIAEPHDRKIKDEVQRAVYERDANTCRLDGWNMERWTTSDPRILELHHVEEHQHGGENIEKNLIVLCSKCHDEVHAGKHAAILKKIKASI